MVINLKLILTVEINYLLIIYSKSLSIQYSVHFASFCVLLLYPYVYVTLFIFRWIISDHPYPSQFGFNT